MPGFVGPLSQPTSLLRFGSKQLIPSIYSNFESLFFPGSSKLIQPSKDIGFCGEGDVIHEQFVPGFRCCGVGIDLEPT